MTTPPLDWACTPDDVAAILRARTKDSTGRELGQWTDDTRPTEPEVQALIDLAAQYVTGAVGVVGDACEGAANNACALRAALLVELSYFPEQVRSDRSPYPELKDLYDQAESALRSCVAGGSGGGAGGEGFSYHSLPIVPATTADAYAYGWRHPEYPATWQLACVAPTPSTPANIDEPEVPPVIEGDIVIGYPGEGDPDRGLPPIINDAD